MRDFGAKNTPLTCLWCGRKLRRVLMWRTTTDGRHEKYQFEIRGVSQWGKIGSGNNFDTGSCAQAFGEAAARNGYRFQPAEAP